MNAKPTIRLARIDRQRSHILTREFLDANPIGNGCRKIGCKLLFSLIIGFYAASVGLAGDFVAQSVSLLSTNTNTTCNINVSGSLKGKVSPIGHLSVARGGSMSFTATPNANYEVDMWLVDGIAAQLGGVNFTRTNILFDQTIQILFRFMRPTPIKQFTEMELASGVFGFRLTGFKGFEYEVQTSPDLVNWSSFSTYMIPTNGSLAGSDPSAVSTSPRYYRAVIRADAGPIALTGFNQDVVVERTAATSQVASYAQLFDPATKVTFYEAGLRRIGGSSSGDEGLPVGGLFVSILDNTTVFQLEPYDTNNALFLDQSTTEGTLTLKTPVAYRELAILATSSNGGGTGSVTIHFTDGSSAGPFDYNAPDWYFHSGSAITHFGRILAVSDELSYFITDDPKDNNPNLYQSNIVLPSPYNTRKMQSLSFARPAGTNIWNNTTTGIFAVSGKK